MRLPHGWKTARRLESGAQFGLATVVLLGDPAAIEQESTSGEVCLMQERCNALVRPRRLRETVPHVVPHSAPLRQALGGSIPVLILRIDAERRTCTPDRTSAILHRRAPLETRREHSAISGDLGLDREQ